MNSEYLVDTHIHLDISPLDADVAGVVARAAEVGVRQMITIGIDETSSSRAVAYATEFDNVYAAVGVHPHDASRVDDETFMRLERLAVSGRGSVVAWGEVGLDYAKEYSPRQVQQDVFARQIELACSLSLPLIIHARDANEDALAILEDSSRKGMNGVFHCFSGDVDIARRVLDLGFYISITGVVTFKNADVTRKVAAFVPDDRLLLETDSPFLSPVPFRGKPNEPARTTLVAREIARVRGVTIEEVACFTTRNARDLFGLPCL